VTIGPLSNQVSEAPKGSRNIFEDPAIAAAAANDPFARWISRNWKLVAVMMAAVAVSMIGYNQFKTIATEKRAAATQTLSDIQTGYDDYIEKDEALATLRSEESVATDPTVKEEKRKKIEEAQKALATLQDKLILMTDSLTGPKPFDTLAALYKGLLLARQKEYDKAQAILAAHPWEKVGEPNSGERFIGELVTLGLARALLDSPQHVQFAREQLLGLAERGTFEPVQAYNAARLVSESDADKAKLDEIARSLVAKYPAQIRFIDGVYQGEK
jgi:hypothetical protein